MNTQDKRKPVLDSKKILITSPIYYVNGNPHIGHVYSNLLCDTLARYYRLKGDKVIFSTGTDEHGAKVEEAAIAKGILPQKFCDEVSAVFKQVFDDFGYSYDYFIRTTDSEHLLVVAEMWKRIKSNGDIYLGYHEGWYCQSDESFVTETQVSIDPNGVKVSKESGRPVKWLKESNYKFRLSDYQDRLLKWLKSGPVVVPEYRKNEIIKFVEGGLRDLSVSRPKNVLKWGIDVPDDPNHVIYVWLDALFNYYTVSLDPETKEPTAWPPDYHIIGKDILKFHAIYWPAFLMSAGLELPKKIVAHGWWTSGGQKMSKFLGNVVDPIKEVEKYTLDPFRFFLLRESNNSLQL